MKQFERCENVDFSNAKGLKTVTTEKQNAKMVKLALTKKAITTQQIADTMSVELVTVSIYTVARRLNNSVIRYKKLLQKPLLLKIHIEKRFTLAYQYIDYDWARVIFSNESTFNLSCEPLKACQLR